MTTPEDASRPEFSRPIVAEKLGTAEKRFDITASAEERKALAERFGILEVPALSATVTLKTLAGGKLVRLHGHFEAEVVQACVVTLEPVPAHLAEDFALTYALEPEEEEIAGGELVFDPDAEDPPEPLLEGVVDIGEAAAEHLALALDPFPRKPGARFEAPAEESAPEMVEKPNPFSALAALKKK